MLKKLIYVFFVIVFLFITACKGQRSVKVNIIYSGQTWYGWMAADNNGNTINVSGLPPAISIGSILLAISTPIPAGTPIPINFDNKTINLGDDKSHITVWVQRLSLPANNTAQKLEVSIEEDYAPGFLYLASSQIMADVSNDTNNVFIPVLCDYDFGATNK